MKQIVDRVVGRKCRMPIDFRTRYLLDLQINNLGTVCERVEKTRQLIKDLKFDQIVLTNNQMDGQQNEEQLKALNEDLERKTVELKLSLWEHKDCLMQIISNIGELEEGGKETFMTPELLEKITANCPFDVQVPFGTMDKEISAVSDDRAIRTK